MGTPGATSFPFTATAENSATHGATCAYSFLIGICTALSIPCTSSGCRPLIAVLLLLMSRDGVYGGGFRCTYLSSSKARSMLALPRLLCGGQLSLLCQCVLPICALFAFAACCNATTPLCDVCSMQAASSGVRKLLRVMRAIAGGTMPSRSTGGRFDLVANRYTNCMTSHPSPWPKNKARSPSTDLSDVSGPRWRWHESG